MKMLEGCKGVLIGLFAFLVTNVSGQCTFTSTFANTVWYDNTKGTLTFTSTRLTGWAFTSYRSTFTSSVSSWQCLDNTDDTFLVLRTVSTFLFERDNSNVNVYGYLCMELTNITDVSFSYYQRAVEQPKLGGERLAVSTLGTLTKDDVCDTISDIPLLDFHVIVKSDAISWAAITCPNTFLFSADYFYTATDGTTFCTSTADVWNTCTNTSQMTFDYSTCSTEVLFSAGGKVLCVATVDSGGYSYAVVINEDVTITASTNRFACLSTDGTSTSVAPGNCTVTQTPYDFPKDTDQTSLGHLLTVTAKYVECGVVSKNGGLTAGETAAIVICVLLIVAMGTCATCTCVCSVVGFVLWIALSKIKGFTFTTEKHLPSYKAVSPVPTEEPLKLIIDGTDPEPAEKLTTTPTDVTLHNGTGLPSIHQNGKTNKLT